MLLRGGCGPDGSTTRIEAPLSAAPWLMLAAAAVALAALALRRRWPAPAQAALNGLFAVALVGAAAFFASLLLAVLPLAVLAAAALWVRVVARAMPAGRSEGLLPAHLACSALAVPAALVAGAGAGWAATAGIAVALLVAQVRSAGRPLVRPS